ncbi:HEPN domain-containing protein [Albibacterium profundi]|uniref:HEPN domain-containing protein n=1 Tax=Albibacterium profundi TaxID=3134906 RepID=A0ABV5CE92_9SPHI
MLSFRTELENPVVEKEIIELDRKIRMFRGGELNDDKFKSLRLARGIYGQRQPGVQMVRIKLPFGQASFKQLLKISDVSDEYAIKNLHLTTRQDIQIHFVSLDRTPELWAELAEDDITLREACGNTVRNVTASPEAGIDKDEPFDVSPYAREMFEYLVRNPICQELGRKFKLGFSSSEKDSAFAYIHDIGFVPQVRTVNGVEERGFRVMLGGGLGAQPMVGFLVHDFLHEDQIIPFAEAAIRVFGRLGERNNRNKARFKYVIQKMGLEAVMELIEEEYPALKSKTYKIDRDKVKAPTLPSYEGVVPEKVDDPLAYEIWRKTNVHEQKQEGYFSVYVKVPTGDISTKKARILIAGLRGYAADEVRVTQNQGLLLKYIKEEGLPHVYNVLREIDLASPGFDSVADITTCPGTDTCNLGISNSTEMARVLENLIFTEYFDLIYNRDLKIKISGCMNSCGQHSLAHIGFHGSSLKAGKSVVPAAQVMLGGAKLGGGFGRAADRVIKVPSKRVEHVLRALIDDYQANASDGELYHDYYDRQTKDYFYRLLKPLADIASITEDEFVDWGQKGNYQKEIGIGECAGVIIDLVATLLYETEEKLAWAKESFENKAWSDAVFHAYSVFISGAKALLLDKGLNGNSHVSIIDGFEENFVDTGEFPLRDSFSNIVLQIKSNDPSQEFATSYLKEAEEFYQAISQVRDLASITD